MAKIFTHVHIYYTNMWPEIKECLANITSEYDLIVTMVEQNKALEADILSFKPNARIKIVENKGFDVGPFVDVLGEIDLDDYDYIIKLHTKRDMLNGFFLGGADVSGDRWRKYLFYFLKNQTLFRKSLSAFEKDVKLGMIGNFRLICRKDKTNKEIVVEAVNKLKELNFAPKEYSFVMGTMFMARAKLFKPIKNLNLTINDFAPSERGKDILPYAMERLFGFIIGAQGYKIRDVLSGLIEKVFEHLCHFIYCKKIKADGKSVIKICRIPMPTKIVKFCSL